MLLLLVPGSPSMVVHSPRGILGCHRASACFDLTSDSKVYCLAFAFVTDATP
jgi:hypothetical protein